MKQCHLFIYVLCFVFFGLTVTVNTALATSCSIFNGTTQEIEKVAKEADEVFEGTVVSEKLLDRSSTLFFRQVITFPLVYEVKIKVRKVWKGKKTRTKYIEREGGVVNGVGRDYLFFPRRQGGALKMSVCDVIQTYEPKFFDPPLNLFLGRPALAQEMWPEETSSAELQKTSWIFLVGIMVLGGVGCLIFILKRRASRSFTDGP